MQQTNYLPGATVWNICTVAPFCEKIFLHLTYTFSCVLGLGRGISDVEFWILNIWKFAAAMLQIWKKGRKIFFVSNLHENV